MSLDVAVKSKVRQSNNLVESPYAQEFTAHEIKIFEIAIASCTISDYELFENQKDKTFSINNKTIAKLLNTKPNVISMEMEKTACRIVKKTMHLRKSLDNGTVEFEIINIIPYARYKDGIFQFRLNYSIIPYILDINKNFTEYQLNFLLGLSSSYAIKLYKLLYQYKNIKIRVFKVDELKLQFGITDKYSEYKNFKQKVLEPSILQINNSTDLKVRFREIKYSRKVEEIEFLFSLNKVIENFNSKSNLNNSSLELLNKPLDLYVDFKFSENTKSLINKYTEERGTEYVSACLKYAKRNAKTNLDIYFSQTLTKGWADYEIEKLETKKKNVIEKNEQNKIDKLKKEQMLEKDCLIKVDIEYKWNELSASDKKNYTDYSKAIIKKDSYHLKSFVNLEHKLPLSIFANTIGKFYDRNLEGYIKNILKISLIMNNSVN